MWNINRLRQCIAVEWINECNMRALHTHKENTHTDTRSHTCGQTESNNSVPKQNKKKKKKKTHIQNRCIALTMFIFIFMHYIAPAPFLSMVPRFFLLFFRSTNFILVVLWCYNITSESTVSPISFLFFFFCCSSSSNTWRPFKIQSPSIRACLWDASMRTWNHRSNCYKLHILPVWSNVTLNIFHVSTSKWTNLSSEYTAWYDSLSFSWLFQRFDIFSRASS